ncbi:PEP/pyruvate-binding domain-containing protein [Thermodesulfobacteriota bacterium]
MPSKALEVNIECSRVDVTISDRYEILKEVMSKYHGIMEGLNTFLTELCHPYKNWQFILKEARGYCLDYYHLIKSHPKGPDATKLYIDIFMDAISTSPDKDVRSNGADNLLIFIQKIIKGSGDELPRFLTAINYGFDRIGCLENEKFFLLVRSFYQINSLAKEFIKNAPPGSDLLSINSLLIRYFQSVYSCWIEEEDPLSWFNKEVNHSGVKSKRFKEIFQPISHRQLKAYQDELESAVNENDGNQKTFFDRVTLLPGYRQIADIYREIPKKLQKAGEESDRGSYSKLIFLLHIMNIAGLSSIHEETLRDINRTLTWLIGNEHPRDLEQLIQKTFAILRGSVRKYPGTALNCIQNMGKAIYKTDESDLVDFFLDSVIDLGFQTPDLKGVGENWQARVNSAHIQNIRTWMEVIELNPTWSKKLISSLILYLSLAGVYIRDTDLFPRDITRFLNSDIGNVYNLAKQLTRLFPSYFNDIGAEGHLRDISTKLDEICLRKDVLIHFLRKQSHVESSNRIIGLMEATLNFWRTKKKSGLKPFIPLNVYDRIETEGPYVDGVHKAITHLFKTKGLIRISDLLKIREEQVKVALNGISGVSKKDPERIELAISFYRLLYQKYTLGFLEIDNYIRQLQPGTFADIDKLSSALSESVTRNKLFKLLVYLEGLKESILSPERYETREDIYHKRHFTVDIPSMYGSYYERKFDTLGLTFRLESLVNTLFEEMVAGIDLELITWDTFFHIYDYLVLFYKALKLDGLLSTEIERQLDLLGHSLGIMDFSFTQFLDIFRGFSRAVRNLVNDYFNAIHQQNLIKILDRLPTMPMLPKYGSQGEQFDKDKLIHRVSEVFLRERISSALGLQQLDLFLSRIMTTLFQQSDKLPKKELRLLLNYDPLKAIAPIGSDNRRASGIIYLGNKGLNLVRLREYGFPVPPGFIITTEVFRCREVIYNYPPAEKNLKDQLNHEISALEGLTGKSFGNPKNPLLLSVRSGAPISQPGMMDTFLDVGINEDIVKGIISITGEQWFAWDCYRRFLQSYGMACDLKRDDFDDIIAEKKQQFGIPYKKDFSGKQMKIVTLAYKDFIRDSGIKIEESPLKQLHVTIRKVFDSWNTAKAKTYRKIMRISDDWGTAVTVQAMVFGNLGQNSGSGVVFTHSPRRSGDMISLWGDYSLGNQGEDVVSGLVKTLPISNKQAEFENRDTDTTLENSFPKIYHTIRNLAKELIYSRNWSPQEMEFTFESHQEKNLYFLQTRDMAIRERKTVLSFITTSDTESRLMGHGIGVSGGAMTGRVVFNLDEIHKWRNAEKETPLILVRGDTVPDDIEEIYEADGLLTARGGSTSHASIVAHRLGKTCVVGCAKLICMEKDSSCSLDQIHLKSGDWLSIDGREGSIYSGVMEIEEVARR